MNEQNYKRLRQWFLQKSYRFQLLKFFYRLLPLLVFITYGAFSLKLILDRDIRIFKFVWIPFVLFVIVSIVRKWINSPRPYTIMNIEPLIKREKIGESFPSRHMLSVSVIAAACFYVNIPAGVAMCITAVFIGLIRVAAGVHFIKDVVFGGLIGLAGGLILFLI